MYAYSFHYHAKELKKDIKDFIEQVVIGGNDSKKQERHQFITEFRGTQGRPSSELIYKDVLKDIKNWGG